ncbi:tRNA splicing endonuclease subunit sen2 [Cryptotrichosporon argae]
MATSTSSTPAPYVSGSKGRGSAHHARYGTPLPVLLPCSPLYPRAALSPSSSGAAGLPASLAALFVDRLVTPHVVGVLDRTTASVWVAEPDDWRVLFERGFFGKGTLSRSEPNWRKTRLDLLKGGASFAAEQLRQKRREERKRFKLDRAQAMMEAVIKAEAVLAGGSGGGAASGPSTPAAGPSVLPSSAEGAGDVDTHVGTDDAHTLSSSPIPDPLAVPASQLTPQTFLVRPTRPDATRNRGKNAFKRRPPPAAAVPPPSAEAAPPAPGGPPADRPAQGGAGEDEEDEEEEEDAEVDPSVVEEMEHLQLSYEEACFLSIGLGVLRVYDPVADSYPPLSSLLSVFLTNSPAHDLHPATAPAALYPSDPFLVRYAAYHHFRSLGWCVRDGVKFCADLLLYRKGPVFSHAAFALLLVPVFADAAERDASPFKNEDWYAERTSWKFLNTVMRVNSLVMKTVIVVYITIPAVSAFPARARLGAGLDARQADLRALLGTYTIREVALTRFGIARRRD